MNTNICYLFSKNCKIGSKLISWGSKHLAIDSDNVPSHGAILVNNRWVIESTIETGVRVISFTKWKKINIICAKIEEPCHIPFSVIKIEFRNLQGCKYDRYGVLYSAIHVLLNKFFNIKVPQVNKWQNPDRYFCLEVLGRLNKMNYEMTTPVELMDKLLQKNVIK